MIALEQARQHMESLGLKQAAEALDNTLDAAAGKQLRVSGRKGSVAANVLLTRLMRGGAPRKMAQGVP